MSQQVTKTRRKRSRDKKGKYRLRVRYKGHIYKYIETPDYGSYKQMYEKYGGKMQFWCGDQPPEKESENGNYSGFRLDSDIDQTHTMSTLARYGKHKCWIDPTYKVDGKIVCLVHNASLGGQAGIFGAVGTVIGLAVAISVISDATHEHWHETGVHHTHHGRTADGRLKVKRVRGGHKRVKSGVRGEQFRTRRNRRKYRRRSNDDW